MVRRTGQGKSSKGTRPPDSFKYGTGITEGRKPRLSTTVSAASGIHQSEQEEIRVRRKRKKGRKQTLATRDYCMYCAIVRLH